MEKLCLKCGDHYEGDYFEHLRSPLHQKVRSREPDKEKSSTNCSIVETDTIPEQADKGTGPEPIGREVEEVSTADAHLLSPDVCKKRKSKMF